jgi:SlyX protein
MSENRFIDMETKISHQENSIEQLQELIHEQGLTILQLEGKLKALEKQIKQISEGNVGPAGEKPPHY